VPIWDSHWDNQVESKASSRATVSVLYTMVASFGAEYAASAVLQLIYTIVQFVSPQLVNALIAYVESDEPSWRGYLYTAILVAATALNTIINSQYFYFQYKIGLKIRTALTAAIYRRACPKSYLLYDKPDFLYL
jgi:ATP-binding cassette subfamily C (CFTR/MRP) protein 1